MEVRVLIVEDEEGAYGAASEAARCACKPYSVKPKIDWFKELGELEEILNEVDRKYDLLILDLKLSNVRDSDKETARILIKMAKKQFIPVVVYSGVTEGIEEEIPINAFPKLIKIVQKANAGDGKTLLGSSVSELIKLKMPLIQLKEKINDQFAAISTETMEKILESTDSGDCVTIQAMIISRLTAFMTSKMDSFISSNGDMPAEAKVIYPALTPEQDVPVAMGDILEDPEKKLWLVASPSCDMALNKKTGKPKIINAVLLRCFKTQSEIDKCFGHINIANQKERVIPLKVQKGISESGVLIMYTKAFKTQLFDDIRGWKKIITVASPYAEDIKATFMRDLMRIGTPDLAPRDDELIGNFTKMAEKQ